MTTSARNSGNRRRIDEELVCADALRHVLLQRYGCQSVEIRREDDDPPDFTVTIDGRAFSTEVTRVVSNQQYHAHVREFADAINAAAHNEGVLVGNYVFSVMRVPTIPRPASSMGRHLIQAAVAYIRATQQREEEVESLLSEDDSGRIEIKKLSAGRGVVGPLWMPPPMRGYEVQNELATLLSQRISAKVRVLTRRGIACSNAILLLYDAYAFGEPDDALAAIQNVEESGWFHSIFWAASFQDRENSKYPAEPGREGIFLRSVNPRWHRIGTASISQIGT
jgi:hypothetical protein